MEIAQKTLCHAIKKLLEQLESLNASLSITLLLGQRQQGKSTLLRQSNLQQIPIDSEPAHDIYYNQHGIFIELNQTWMTQDPTCLQQLLKKINRCHRSSKITGVLYCVNTNSILNSEPNHINELISQESIQLKLIQQALGYCVNLSFIFTQLDALAGFCEYYQGEHISELKKPLGFSLIPSKEQAKFIHQYRKKFEQFIESLSQQVIHKIHPVRSAVKRNLIREFPFQLASLRVNIQSLLQIVPLDYFQVRDIFFASAEQGGLSNDRLVKKIQHEYALTVPNEFHQSVNYRPYFIDGALKIFQAQCQHVINKNHYSPPKKSTTFLMAGMGLVIGSVVYLHVHTSNMLDEASKALLTYETVKHQSEHHAAEYYLTNASHIMDKVHANHLSMPIINTLKQQIKKNSQQHIQGHFIPLLLNDVEQIIVDNRAPPHKRFNALKIYLMLGQSDKFARDAVLDWFEQLYSTYPADETAKRISLLKEVISEPMQPLPIHKQTIIDAQNDLKALPESYFYYSLAKSYFSKKTLPIEVSGFNTSHKRVPVYLTKAYFQEAIEKIPAISKQIRSNDWVLNQTPPSNINEIITQAYCYEYVSWWKAFLNRTQPHHIQSYKEGYQLIDDILAGGALPRLIHLIQEQTSPIFNDHADLFNQSIANHFSELNLVSESSLNSLSLHVEELRRFLNTLSAINDQGKTAFLLTKKRFSGDSLSNPLSILFDHVKKSPNPISTWTDQIAGDIWYLLVNDTRHYINAQWKKHVLADYNLKIKNRFPLHSNEQTEVSIQDFELFFSPNGQLNQFIKQFVKPFLNTTHAKWSVKELDHYRIPIRDETIKELMRANVISTMFFPMHTDHSQVHFSLQKIALDPIIDGFELSLGEKVLHDSQVTQSNVSFDWPQENASLSIKAVDGNTYSLHENGPWAFFKLLQKVNVILDDEDSSKLQILFEINGNSGRYYLKAQNQINPFIPGILSDFKLPEQIA